MTKTAKVTSLKDKRHNKLLAQVKKSKKDVKLVSEGIADLKNPKKILKKQLELVLELLPLAEEAYREKRYESNAKALNSLIEQSNDLMNQIETLEVENKLRNLIENILDPMVEALIRQLSMDLGSVKKSIKEIVTRKYKDRVDRIIKDCLISYGQNGKEIYKKAKVDVEIALENKK